MRILLVRLSSFGDVVFTLPAAKALKEGWPGAELAWAIEEPFAPLVRGASYVDRVLLATTRRWRKAPLAAGTHAELRRFLDEARAFRPDLLVDAQGLAKSAWATLLVPAARKLGFGWRSATERLSCLALDERVETRRAHVADRSLDLAAAATGRRRLTRLPDVSHLLAQAPGAELAAWLAPRERPFALLQPFSSARAKEWRTEHVADFARRAADDGLDVVVRWGPGERERAEALVAACGGRAELAPATDPVATALLASRAAVFVGVDSGPTHLAAAAGAPTLALFGPTDPARFGPIGERALAWPLPGYNSPSPAAVERAAHDVHAAARALCR